MEYVVVDVARHTARASRTAFALCRAELMLHSEEPITQMWLERIGLSRKSALECWKETS
jgi:hypothetical protein